MNTRSGMPAREAETPTDQFQRSEACWRILVATDASACAVHAQRLLARMAFPAGTQIQVVAVAPDPFVAAGTHGDPGFANWRINAELCGAEQELLAIATREAVSRLSRANWEVKRAVLHGDTCPEILAAAQRFRANLILVGTKGLTGWHRLLLGSTAREVARHAPCSVLIARGSRSSISRVVLAIDGSANGSRAVELVARLPLPARAEVLVAHVRRPNHLPTEPRALNAGNRGNIEAPLNKIDSRQPCDQLVIEACDRLAKVGKHTTTQLLTGTPAVEILKLTENAQADLLVAGARGVSLIPGLLLGSVADLLLQNSACSLLLVR